MDDFDDIDFTNAENGRLAIEAIHRKSSSPSIVTSFKHTTTLKRDDSKSELVSESVKRLTADTKETVVKMKLKIPSDMLSSNKKLPTCIEQIRNAMKNE
jgi:hypothetical protein